MAKFETFLGANTPNGFSSMMGEIYNPYKDMKVYIIKGGAGTGKSTFMKKIAAEGERQGYTVERIYCSSDPDSLDGVKIDEKNFLILDGTAPHVAEPMFPGACENIINLGEFWDKKKLYENREKIEALTVENSLYHRKSSLFLSSAGAVYEDIWKTASAYIKEDKIGSFSSRFAAREMPKKKAAQPGKKTRRYISGISPKGLVFFDSPFKALSLRTIGIKDEYSAVSSVIIDRIGEGAVRNGYDVIYCPCVMNKELNEHIIIPEVNLSVVTVKKQHKMNLQPDRLIHAERFLDKEGISEHKNKLSFNKKVCDELIKESIFYLKKAKEVHDRLEKCYIEAMDFDRMNEFTKKFIDENFKKS